MSDRLTPEREAEIAARAAAATPGPWEEHAKYGRHFYAYLGGPYLRGVGTLNFGEGDDADADRALTVNAQTDITALLAELAAVRAERDEAQARVAVVEEFVADRAQYITAIRNCHPDNAHDYYRWQGHAESRRQLAQKLGLPVAWPADDEEAAR